MYTLCVCVSVPLDISGILSPFEDFEDLLEPAWLWLSGFGRNPKKPQSLKPSNVANLALQ